MNECIECLMAQFCAKFNFKYSKPLRLCASSKHVAGATASVLAESFNLAFFLEAVNSELNILISGVLKSFLS